VGLQIVPLVIAIVVHELAHGHVARLCGDPTAARAGRLSLNPLRHLDPVGSFLVPGLLALGSYAAGVRPVLFGWARPVPIDTGNFAHPRRDMVLVALAGPAANAALALGGAMALAAAVQVPAIGRLALEILAATVVVNCILGIFNLLPVPPLDGGRVLQAALPRSWARHLRTLDGVGMAVVVLLVMQTNVVGVLARPVIAWLLSWAG
jgi:Zn-dependent protease